MFFGRTLTTIATNNNIGTPIALEATLQKETCHFTLLKVHST